MLTFLFLVSLTATTVLLLAIAADEVVRLMRATFTQAHDDVQLGNAVVSPAVTQEPSMQVSPESGELRQFPQRVRAAARASQPAELANAPDRAA